MNLSVLTRRLMTVLTSGAGIACTVALVAPASFAQQASMSGATTAATPSGFVTSASMEVVLPGGFSFGGPSFTVTPSYLPHPAITDGLTVSVMTLNGGTIAPATPSTSFEAAAAAVLTDTAMVKLLPELATGMIKAGAGIDGF